MWLQYSFITLPVTNYNVQDSLSIIPPSLIWGTLKENFWFRCSVCLFPQKRIRNGPLLEAQGTWTNPPYLEVGPEKSNLLFIFFGLSSTMIPSRIKISCNEGLGNFYTTQEATYLDSFL